jgi:hypothetical protein
VHIWNITPVKDLSSIQQRAAIMCRKLMKPNKMVPMRYSHIAGQA